MTTVTLPPPVEIVIPSQAAAQVRPRLGRRVLRALRPREGRVFFLLAAATYLTAATILTLHYGVIDVDSMSRVANATYVLQSRFPHLAAVGFVWNPLPSLADLPFIPFAHFWPELKNHAFAGNITSSLFMAGAVTLMLGTLRDFGCSRPVRYALTVLFALNPMIVLFAANGMSEACMLFTLMLATRMLAKWLRTGDPSDLVRTGMALGLAYLARYEALAAGAATIGLVAAISFIRGRSGVKSRLRDVVTDALLVGFPFVVSVGLWAISSKVLVHQWFPTISSSYGNTAQVGAAASELRHLTGQGTSEAFLYAANQLFGLEPTLFITIGAAAIFALHLRDNRALAPLAILGSVLAFDVIAFLSGHSFGWLRFDISVIPLATLMVACIPAARVPAPKRRLRNPLLSACLTTGRLSVNGLLAAAAVLLLAITLPSTWHTMMNHRLGREETHDLTAIFYPHQATDQDRQALNSLHVERQVAAYIDSLHLRNGSVLTDSGDAYGVLASTKDLKAFIITSDLDFERAVADPPRFGVRYILTPEHAYYDAVQSAYPGIYDNGGGFSTLAKSWKGYGYSPAWRLYRVTTAAYVADHDTLRP